MKQSRRDFIRNTGYGVAAMSTVAAAQEKAPVDARTYLGNHLYTREEVDDWLAKKAFPFAKYDAELGWLLRDGRVPDGVDGSTSTYTYRPGRYDERLTINYADRPCRINTYGDSFTQCHQVSDGETWQEVLAAHLCEPVRNFGVGGWSVYQAYRRMLREEARAPADMLVLNIYDDDHYRNLDSWRNIRVHKHERFIEPTLPHLRVNHATGKCQERENPCPTEESVYNLCDLDWVEERFRDDFVLGIMLAYANAREGNEDLAYKAIMDMAQTHGINTNIDRGATASASARELHTHAALLATMRIVEWVEAYAKGHGKKVLYILSFNARNIARRIEEEKRFDQPFVDFMNTRQLPYIDLMEAHAADFVQFSVDVQDYLQRYYIGHYNPTGNFFTALSIKNKLLEMLDPKPPAYPEP